MKRHNIQDTPNRWIYNSRQSSHFSSQSSRFSGQSSHFSKQPSSFSGQPSSFSGQPSSFSGQSSHFSSQSPSFSRQSSSSSRSLLQNYSNNNLNINFRDRTRFFKKNTYVAMGKLYQATYGCSSENNWDDLLTALKETLTDQYGNSQADIYSQFLQNLIYCANHLLKDDKTHNWRNAINKKILQQLDEKWVIWQDPQENYTILNSLCRSGDQGGIELLLQKIKNMEKSNQIKLISAVNKDGFSPLNTACKEGYGEIVKALLETAQQVYGDDEDLSGLKAFISNCDNYGFSPLSTACKEGHKEIVKMLLEAAEKVYAQDPESLKRFIGGVNKDGFSPLNAACKEGHKEIVKMLLEAAEKVYAQDPEGLKRFIGRVNKDGFSPLNAACKEGYGEIVGALLKTAEKVYDQDQDLAGFKAFMSADNNYGFSPLNTACKEGYGEIVGALLKTAEKVYDQDQDLAGFKAFMSADNNYGFSPLNAACKEGYEEIVGILLAFAKKIYDGDPGGFNDFLNSQTNRGFTPMGSCREASLNAQKGKISSYTRILALLRAQDTGSTAISSQKRMNDNPSYRSRSVREREWESEKRQIEQSSQKGNALLTSRSDWIRNSDPLHSEMCHRGQNKTYLEGPKEGHKYGFYGEKKRTHDNACYSFDRESELRSKRRKM